MLAKRYLNQCNNQVTQQNDTNHKRLQQIKREDKRELTDGNWVTRFPLTFRSFCFFFCVHCMSPIALDMLLLI